MAEKYPFVIGTLHQDFLQMKTTDGVYLQDLLEKVIFPSLQLYNERTTALARLLVYRYDDADANKKDAFSSDSFELISDLERPSTRTGYESWNIPVPMQRYGAGTKMNLEVLKQMTSKAITEWHNAKLIADNALLAKKFFEFMLKNTPQNLTDELTHLACIPKVFWNNDGVDVPRPNGQITFANTHNHYLDVASAGSLGTAGAELTILLACLTEHENMSGQIILWARTGTTVNLITAESVNFRGVNKVSSLFTDPNTGYSVSGLVQALVTGQVSLGHNVNVVGTWKGAIVVETPDLPAGYILATVFSGDNSPLQPLGWREHPQFKGLNLMDESGGNPIIGKDAQYRRYLALGVHNRSAGAVLYTTDTTWAEPSFV